MAQPADARPLRLSRPRFALLVVLGVYPIITLLTYVVFPLTAGWEIWQRTLVVTPLMVALMVWGVIPTIHRFAPRFIFIPPGK